MKWAAFEESVKNVDEARNIISQLVAKYPMLLEARYGLNYVLSVFVFIIFIRNCRLPCFLNLMPDPQLSLNVGYRWSHSSLVISKLGHQGADPHL